MPVLFRVHDSVKVSVISENRLKVAVLVLNYNGKRYLKECFESLRSQTYDNYDVFLVDNGSSDGSVRYVHEHFPWVKVIAFKENLGFAKAYNEAIQTVDTNLVALLNNDTKVDRRWLQELVNAILEDELIAAVGSKILLYDNPQLLNHAGAKITPIGGGFDIGLYNEDCERYDVKKYVGAACGAAMLVRKDLFLKIRGFDEDFFMYFEDTDFCWRAWLWGFKIVYVPDSIIYHKLGGSWGPRKSSVKMFLGEKNRLLTVIKNFEVKNVVRALIISVVYNLTRFFILLKFKHHRGVIAIIKANYWVLHNFKKIMGKRRIVQKHRKVSDAFLEKTSFLTTLREGFFEFNRLNWVETV